MPDVATMPDAATMPDKCGIAYVDGPRLRRALLAACAHARQYKAELNRINVFPVPDGDTGTNLALTLDAIAGDLAASRERRVDRVAAAVARSAVMGARGNCGMMLSQFLIGFAGGLEGRARASTNEFGAALMAGSRSLDAAVEEPVEGTILTVVRDSATAAGATGGPTPSEADSATPSAADSSAAAAPSAARDADFTHLTRRLLDAARDSLERTPELLPVLARAGVVDAGAKGFVRMVEGVVGLIEHGDAASPAMTAATPGAAAATSVPDGTPDPGSDRPDWSPIGAMDHPLGQGTRRYCTEILVEGSDLPSEKTVRAALSEDSEELLVIRSGEILKVHLHTDHPRDAIDYCGTLGTVTAHKAEDMFAQFEAARSAAEGAVRRPVGILVDSGADLPDAVMRAHGIHMIPLLLIDGDTTLRDRIDVSTEEFHARLDSDGPLPTTSQPPPGQFREAFEKASDDSEVVVAILLSASLSGVFQSAEHGAALAPELDIRLVDSRAASILVGLLALKAAELAESGMRPAEIVAEVERIRGQSGIAFTVRNLDRLIASGRLSHFAGWLGGLLDLKPVLGLGPDGRIQALGKARGLRRVRKLLVRKILSEIPDGARKVRFGIIHAGPPDVVAPVRAELEKRFPGAEILVSPITPVIATHLGIGAWGLAYMVED